MRYSPSAKPHKPHRVLHAAATAFTGFSGGIVNGLLGTGGGILLLLSLRRSARAQDAFASALVCILPLSLLSVWLYCENGTADPGLMFSHQTLPYLLGAIPGGMLGAYLLDRMKLSVVQYLFAALLLFSGGRMAFG